MSRRAAIYSRISRDDKDDGAGVARQEEDCRALCQRKGWTVAEVLTDNDISAYSGRLRPAYERMVAMLDRGEVDAVVAWAPERLHRSPRELEDFIDLVERVGALVETVKSGSWDMSSSNSRMVARMLGAVSRAESERIGERVSRAHQQAKANGLWRGPVPYGMRKTAVAGAPEADPATADVVRSMAERVIRGDALTTIAADLNKEGVPPKRGKAWTHTSVLRLLQSPAIAGMIEVEGELRPAAFSGLLDPADWRAVQNNIARRPRGEARRPREKLTLLGGILHCAEHDVPLYGSGDKYARTYHATVPGLCMTRTIREPIDGLVRDVVVERLSRPDAKAVLIKPEDRSRSDDEAAALRLRRDEIADLVADGLLPLATARPRLADIAARLVDLEGRQSPGLLGARELADPATAWVDWTVPQRREVLRLLFDSICLAHGTYNNGPRVDLSRLRLSWRSDGPARAEAS